MSYDKRAILADGIQFSRMILENYSQSIGPLHPVHDFRHCLQRITMIIIVQKMGDHLCVRLRYEFITMIF